MERFGGHIGKNLLEVFEQLSRVKNGPIDACVLQGWEATIRSELGLDFSVEWLDQLLVMVKYRNDPRAHFLCQIARLEKELSNLSKVTSEKKMALNQLVVSVAAATSAAQQAKMAENDVRMELDRKKQEWSSFQSV